jgi:hypothetical protein
VNCEVELPHQSLISASVHFTNRYTLKYDIPSLPDGHSRMAPLFDGNKPMAVCFCLKHLRRLGPEICVEIQGVFEYAFNSDQTDFVILLDVTD